MASNTNRTPTKAKGYEAARIIVEELLDAAQKKRPTGRKVDQGSTAYRQGYFMGLVAAHSQNALGDFPKHNVDAIRQALARKYGA